MQAFRIQPWPPLFNGFINDALLQLSPDTGKTLLQIIDVPNRCLIDAFLYQPPDHIVNWIEVWWIAGQTSGPMKSGVSCRSSSMVLVSSARCAGALSCWNIKTSPDIRRISGNICCFFRSDELFGEFAGHSPAVAEYMILYGINAFWSTHWTWLSAAWLATLIPYKILYSARRMPRKLTKQLVRSKEKLEPQS